MRSLISQRAVRYRYLFGWIALAVVLVGCSRQGKIDRHLERGNRYFNETKYAEAVIEYLNVLQADRSQTEAIRQLGLAYFAQQDFVRAFPFLKRALESDASNDDLRLKVATICFLAAEYDLVKEHIAVLLEHNPRDLEALKLLCGVATTAEEAEAALGRLNEAAPGIQDQSRVELLRGHLQLRQRDLAAAEQSFLAAQRLDPQSADALLTLGTFYLQQGRTEQAGRQFEAAAHIAPTNAIVQLRWADFKRQTGELEQSKQLLTDMTRQTPDVVFAWHRLAEIAAAEGDLAKADENLREALQRQPDHLPALILQAQLLVARDQIPQAIARLEKLSEQNPKYAPVHHQLALAYLRAQDQRKALVAIQRAVAAAPDAVEPTLLAAQLQIATGEPGPAVKSLEVLVARYPKLIRAQLLLGAAYLANGQTAEAIAAYKRVTELSPKAESGYHLLGLAYLASDDRASAKAAFEQAYALNPKQITSLARIIDLHVAAQDTDGALARLQQESQARPAEVPLQLMLGRIHLARGEFEPAEAVYRRVAELAPKGLAGYQMLAQIYARTGRHAEAIATIEKALAIAPDDLANLMLAGTLYQHPAGDLKRAREAYERFLSLQPQSAPVANNLATVYLQLGQPDKAYEFAAQAHKIAPDEAAIQDTLGWTVYLRGDHPRALTLIQTSARRLAAHPEVQYHLGAVQLALGNETLGRQALQQAVTTNVTFAGSEEAKMLLSVVAIDPGNVRDEDAARLQDILTRRPDEPAVLFRLACYAQQKNQAATARELLEHLVETNPYHVPGVINLVEIYAAQATDQPTAVALIARARNSAPDDPRLILAQARLMLLTGQYQAAVDGYEIALPKQPDAGTGYVDLAQAYYFLGNTARAEESARTGLGRHLPATAEAQARDLLVVLQALQPADQIAEAQANVASLLQRRPDFLPARLAQAELAQRAGNYHEAQSLCEAILAVHKSLVPATQTLAEALYAEGRALLDAGQQEPAKQIFQRALALNPKSISAPAARAVVEKP